MSDRRKTYRRQVLSAISASLCNEREDRIQDDDEIEASIIRSAVTWYHTSPSTSTLGWCPLRDTNSEMLFTQTRVRMQEELRIAELHTAL